MQVVLVILCHLKWSNNCLYQGHELAKSVDVYNLLEASFDQLNEKIDIPDAPKYSSDKWGSEFRHKNGNYASKWCKQMKSSIRNFVTVNDIQKLTSASRSILRK